MPSPAGLTLGRVKGVPIVITPSWALIGLLLTLLYGPAIHSAVPDLRSSSAYLAAFGFAVVFFGCVLAHELGHTLVSLRLGYRVRRVVLFALGGLSEVESEPTRARDELLIAGAGPLVSIVITVAAWLGYLSTPTDTLFGVLLALLWSSNLLLAAFNLLPGLPLDGGRLLRAVLAGCGASALTSTRIAAWSGRAVALCVMVAGIVINARTSGITAGLLGFAIGAYLWFGAGQSLQLATVTARLPSIDVQSLVRPGMFVAADVSVAEALRRAWEYHARGLVVLDPAERPGAIVDEAMIAAVPAERRAWTPVATVARRLEPGLILPAGLSAETLFARIRSTPAREYLVMNADGTPAGLISSRDFAERLRATA